MLTDDVKMDLKMCVPMKDLLLLYNDKTGSKKNHASKDTLIALFGDAIERIPELNVDLYNIIEKNKFAGRVSVSWAIPSNVKKSDNKSKDNTELEDIIFDKKYIEEAIVKYAKTSPFIQPLKPELTEKPAIDKATWIDENTLRIDFVYCGRTRYYKENYKTKSFKSMETACALIRFNKLPGKYKDIVIECRIEQNKTQMLLSMINEILGINAVRVKFEERDIINLNIKLMGNKRIGKHRPLEGDIGLEEYHALKTVKDLDDSPKYKEKTKNTELQGGRYQFEYTTTDNVSFPITYNISLKGNIWFISSASEEVIQYVLSCVREIKGF